MAPRKKKVTVEEPVKVKVAVLDTHVGEKLFIRSNPSEEEVRSFVKEHNSRYHDGKPGGPSDIAAYHIQAANFFPSEEEANDPTKGTEIDISDLVGPIESV